MKSEVFALKDLERIDMIARDTIDIRAVDAEVVQLTIVERSEFTNRLLVSGPLLEGFTNVHLKSPVVCKDRYSLSLGGRADRVWSKKPCAACRAIVGLVHVRLRLGARRRPPGGNPAAWQKLGLAWSALEEGPR